MRMVLIACLCASQPSQRPRNSSKSIAQQAIRVLRVHGLRVPPAGLAGKSLNAADFQDAIQKSRQIKVAADNEASIA